MPGPELFALEKGAVAALEERDIAPLQQTNSSNANIFNTKTFGNLTGIGESEAFGQRPVDESEELRFANGESWARVSNNAEANEYGFQSNTLVGSKVDNSEKGPEYNSETREHIGSTVLEKSWFPLNVAIDMKELNHETLSHTPTPRSTPEMPHDPIDPTKAAGDWHPDPVARRGEHGEPDGFEDIHHDAKDPQVAYWEPTLEPVLENPLAEFRAEFIGMETSLEKEIDRVLIGEDLNKLTQLLQETASGIGVNHENPAFMQKLYEGVKGRWDEFVGHNVDDLLKQATLDEEHKQLARTNLLKEFDFSEQNYHHKWEDAKELYLDRVHPAQFDRESGSSLISDNQGVTVHVHPNAGTSIVVPKIVITPPPADNAALSRAHENPATSEELRLADGEGSARISSNAEANEYGFQSNAVVGSKVDDSEKGSKYDSETREHIGSTVLERSWFPLNVAIDMKELNHETLSHTPTSRSTPEMPHGSEYNSELNEQIGSTVFERSWFPLNIDSNVTEFIHETLNHTATPRSTPEIPHDPMLNITEDSPVHEPATVSTATSTDQLGTTSTGTGIDSLLIEDAKGLHIDQAHPAQFDHEGGPSLISENQGGAVHVDPNAGTGTGVPEAVVAPPPSANSELSHAHENPATSVPSNVAGNMKELNHQTLGHTPMSRSTPVMPHDSIDPTKAARDWHPDPVAHRGEHGEPGGFEDIHHDAKDPQVAPTVYSGPILEKSLAELMEMQESIKYDNLPFLQKQYDELKSYWDEFLGRKVDGLLKQSTLDEEHKQFARTMLLKEFDFSDQKYQSKPDAEKGLHIDQAHPAQFDREGGSSLTSENQGATAQVDPNAGTSVVVPKIVIPPPPGDKTELPHAHENSATSEELRLADIGAGWTRASNINSAVASISKLVADELDRKFDSRLLLNNIDEQIKRVEHPDVHAIIDAEVNEYGRQWNALVESKVDDLVNRYGYNAEMRGQIRSTVLEKAGFLPNVAIDMKNIVHESLIHTSTARSTPVMPHDPMLNLTEDSPVHQAATVSTATSTDQLGTTSTGIRIDFPQGNREIMVPRDQIAERHGTNTTIAPAQALERTDLNISMTKGTQTDFAQQNGSGVHPEQAPALDGGKAFRVVPSNVDPFVAPSTSPRQPNSRPTVSGESAHHSSAFTPSGRAIPTDTHNQHGIAVVSPAEALERTDLNISMTKGTQTDFAQQNGWRAHPEQTPALDGGNASSAVPSNIDPFVAPSTSPRQPISLEANSRPASSGESAHHSSAFARSGRAIPTDTHNQHGIAVVSPAEALERTDLNISMTKGTQTDFAQQNGSGGPAVVAASGGGLSTAAKVGLGIAAVAVPVAAGVGGLAGALIGSHGNDKGEVDPPLKPLALEPLHHHTGHLHDEIQILRADDHHTMS